MVKIIILLSGILIPMNLFSQKTLKTTEDIAGYLCKRLDSIDMKLPPSIIEQQCLTIFSEFRYTPEYNDLVVKLNKDFLDNNPDKELYEAGFVLSCDLTYYLMQNCETFQSMILFNGDTVPEISEVTDKIGDHFTKLLNIRMQTSEMSQELVDECLEIVMEINSDILDEEFPGDEFITYLVEFQLYTMTRCEPYMRWMIDQNNWNYFDLTIR